MGPVRIAARPDGHLQLLYFTSSSLSADDRFLYLISDCDGQPNLERRDLATGRQRRLTDNHEGFCKSYVYFDGAEGRGLAKASPSLHPDSGALYYLHGRQLRRADPDGGQARLAELPDDQVSAFTHVSADGTLLCVPTTDARALEGPLDARGFPGHDVDARVQAEELSSYLRVFDTRDGAQLACEPVPRAWVTHVQFSPVDPRLILYNHEWPADCGVRRMWLWDGRGHRPLRGEGKGRSSEDWTCHEMWQPDGRGVVYHGAYAGGRAYLGRVDVSGGEPVELPLPDGWRGYGHFTVSGSPDMLVSDGYYRRDDDAGGRAGEWISVQHVDWAARTLRWQPLCRHGSSFSAQDNHPHPVFDHAGAAVYFTSDRDGRRAVYRVAAGPR